MRNICGVHTGPLEICSVSIFIIIFLGGIYPVLLGYIPSTFEEVYCIVVAVLGICSLLSQFTLPTQHLTRKKYWRLFVYPMFLIFHSGDNLRLPSVFDVARAAYSDAEFCQHFRNIQQCDDLRNMLAARLHGFSGY